MAIYACVKAIEFFASNSWSIEHEEFCNTKFNSNTDLKLP